MRVFNGTQVTKEGGKGGVEIPKSRDKKGQIPKSRDKNDQIPKSRNYTDLSIENYS